MSEAVKRNFRLFPILIGVAILALAIRTTSLITGYDDLISARAIAAETQDKPSDTQDKPSQETGGQTSEQNSGLPSGAAASSSNQPLMVGVPSSEEMELITQLRQRREALEKREVQLDLQEQLLASTEKRINDKITELSALEGKIKQHLGVFDAREKEQLQSIVSVYEKMKAKDAAPRFETLDLSIQVDLVSMMKPTKIADLMSKMSPQAAQKLTTELATVAKAPSLEDIQSNDR